VPFRKNHAWFILSIFTIHVNRRWNMSRRARLREFAWLNTPTTLCGHSRNCCIIYSSLHILTLQSSVDVFGLFFLINCAMSPFLYCNHQFTAQVSSSIYILPFNKIFADHVSICMYIKFFILFQLTTGHGAHIRLNWLYGPIMLPQKWSLSYWIVSQTQQKMGLHTMIKKMEIPPQNHKYWSIHNFKWINLYHSY
jgi:hypothetical protein